MTGLLVSVCNIDESEIVLDSETDIIDLKNPAHGALGALEINEISQIVHLINGSKVVSATIGDLPMDPELLVKRVQEVASTGVDIVKVGFFGNFQHQSCISALKRMTAQGVNLVAVLLADQHPNLSLLKAMKDAGFYGVMLDTASKSGKSLLDFIAVSELQKFVSECKSLGLMSGLAGSLGKGHLETLVPLESGYIGFRGSLCENSMRTASLSHQKVMEINLLLRKYNRCPV